MLTELVLRFLVGGFVVLAFAVVGDVLRPRSFAGLFGAAPSVALATLALTFAKHPPPYVSAEGRSMVAGAVAFLCYSLVVTWLIGTRRWRSWLAASSAWATWLAAAFSLWRLVLQ